MNNFKGARLNKPSVIGNGKKSEAVGVRVNFKESLSQLLFRHLKITNLKLKIAGRVNISTQHLATLLNLVERCCVGADQTRETSCNIKKFDYFQT